VAINQSESIKPKLRGHKKKCCKSVCSVTRRRHKTRPWCAGRN